MGYLGRVVNTFLALRSKDFKPLDERREKLALLLGGLIDQATSYQ